MKKLLRLICMAGIILMFTQCGKDSEPEPETVQETWQLTYDDYHVVKLKGDKAEIPQEYLNITRKVTVLRKGNDLSIKGIFNEYPNAWTKFTIRGDKLYAEQGQELENGVSNPMLFYWGNCRNTFEKGITFTSFGIAFTLPDYNDVYISGNGIRISADGNTIKFHNDDGLSGAFWYVKSDHNPYVEFYTTWEWSWDPTIDLPGNELTETSTGYPDIGYMVNMVFQKTSNINRH